MDTKSAILESALTRNSSAASSSAASSVIVPDNTTENGQPGHSSTHDVHLDFFGSVVRQMRTRVVKKIKIKTSDPENLRKCVALFQKAVKIDPKVAIALVFHLRDPRGGKGEKDLAIVCMLWLRSAYPLTYISNLEAFIDYGCFKDLHRVVKSVHKNSEPILGEKSWIELEYAAEVISHDLEVLKNWDRASDEKPPAFTLCAKWLPSVNKQNFNREENGSQGSLMASLLFPPTENKHAGWSEKQYRYALRDLRAALNVVEQKMSARQWDKINFETLPSCAHNLYREALKKHQPEKYQAYLDALKVGEAKINSTGMEPHVLLRPYSKSRDAPIDQTIEGQWKDMISKLKSHRDKIRAESRIDEVLDDFAIVDVSGSMVGIPMEVAIALGLILSELSTGPLAGKVCTFHETPTIFDVKGETLLDRYRCLASAPWGGSTNLWKAFQLLLDMGVTVRNFFIFTDMHFDQANRGNNWSDSYTILKEMFEKKGLKIPNIIFWNLRASTVSFPTTSSTPGVAMVSGYSPQLMKIFMSADTFDPVSIMMNTIHPYLQNVTLHPQDF